MLLNKAIHEPSPFIGTILLILWFILINLIIDPKLLRCKEHLVMALIYLAAAHIVYQS